MFETKLTGFETVPGQDGEEIRGIRAFARQDGREISIPCRHVVLAVGHSARDTFEMLKEEGVSMEQKPFSIGVRIEHPQDLIDIAQYGRPGRELGPASCRIQGQLQVYRRDGRRKRRLQLLHVSRRRSNTGVF